MNDSSSPTTQILNGASNVNIGTGTFSTVGRDQYNHYHTTINQNESQATVLNERVTTVIGAMSGGAQAISCLLYIFEREGNGKLRELNEEELAITSHNEALRDLKIRIASTVDVFVNYHEAIEFVVDEKATKVFEDLFWSFQELLVEIKKLVKELEHRSSPKFFRNVIRKLQPVRRKVSADAFTLRAQFMKLQARVNEGSQTAIARKGLLVTQGATYTAQDLHDAMENEIPRLKGLCDREIRLKLAEIAMVYVQNRDRAWLIAIKFFNKYFTADASNPPNPTEQSTPATEANATSDYPPPSHHHPVENIIEDLTRIGQIGGGGEPSEDPFNDPDHIRDNDSILSYWSNALYDFRD